LIHSLI